MSLLEIQGVQKSFQTRGGRVGALGPIDLTIEPGQFVCIVGPSGCGKSTLLHLLAGLDKADSGQISANGEPINGPSPNRLLIFQDGGLFPWLTVRENVEFGLRLQGADKKTRRQKAEVFLERVQLKAFADAHVHQLSGGMRQRAALARGLAVDPRVLLMDEPFAALDAQTRDDLGVELQRLWSETGKTIIFITHNLREAASLGDRVLVMSRRPGRIIHEIHVDLPRPRRIEDTGVIDAIRPIVDDLRTEVTAAHAEAGAPA